MRSCQSSLEIKPFQFLPHSQILDNFLAFKDYVFEDYSAEKYSVMRDLVLSVALRQVTMNPTGPLYEVGVNFFNQEGLAIALTGLILQLKEKLNKYFDLPKSFFSIALNTMPFFSQKERKFFNDRIDAIVGISEKNQLDDKTKKEIYSFLAHLERIEFIHENHLKTNLSRLTLFAHGDTVTKHCAQSSQASPYTNRH